MTPREEQRMREIVENASLKGFNTFRESYHEPLVARVDAVEKKVVFFRGATWAILGIMGVIASFIGIELSK